MSGSAPRVPLSASIDEIVNILASKLDIDGQKAVLADSIAKLRGALILNASQLKTAHDVLRELGLPLLLEEELLRIGTGQKNALVKITSGVREVISIIPPIIHGMIPVGHN
jgi:hypothetical protein